jgi:hypothetical protein
MRIISVGIDSLTAAYVKNGRVVRVEIRAETVLAGVGDEEDQSLWGALARLTEGDLVEIEGTKDSKNQVLLAQKVALAERTLVVGTSKHGHKR